MMWDDGNGRWGHMHDSGAWWVMVLVMLLLVAAVVVLVVALLRGTVPLTPAPRQTAGPRSDPRAILQERFARGEIDESDYRSRVRALDDTATGT